MRLTKIKLAGFKSFVDPTTVTLPSQLVGIVGPNGCGKSNVIDAVRWVMGESSAKYLRGESMTDVIFNGSSSRKPVSQASIELVFDNRDGSLGGQYASYSEISIKRQVNREGQSHYYLNGTRCRRRDITDVFLGTGLGPRSYAIIEQGMISRVIEAKPEELRVYFEEAAGISLYKERRKETERRMRDTRENLERLNDVRDEVGKQLDKLKRQADTAERYKQLKAEERTKRGELLAMQVRGLDEQLSTVRAAIRDRETAIESEIAKLRDAERQIEESRARHTEFSDDLNRVQGRYYALGSDIARIEQQITHQRELQDKLKHDLARGEGTMDELSATLTEDQEKLTVVEDRLAELEPQVEAAVEAEEAANEQFLMAQSAIEDWQLRWDEFNAQAAEPVREAQVERTRIEQGEQRAQDLIRRRERLQREAEFIQIDDMQASVDELAEQDAALGDAVSEAEERFQDVQQNLEEQQTQLEDLLGERGDLRGELQNEQARLGSLKTLQEAALGQDDSARQTWLAARGWENRARLAERLSVQAGWEKAAETVLGEFLQALCVDDLGLDTADGEALESGQVALIGECQGQSDAPADSLAALVEGPSALRDLLGVIRVADDLAQAQVIREQLQPGESIVTRDGVWLGRAWTRLRAGRDEQGSVLAREKDIQSLEASIAERSERLAVLDEQIEHLQSEVGELESRRDDLQIDLQEQRQAWTRVQAQLDSKRSRLEDALERRERLREESEETAEAIGEAETAVREARRRLDEALARAETLDGQKEGLQQERETLQQRREEAREQLRQHRDGRHDLALKLESARTARESLFEAVERIKTQRDNAMQRCEELREQLMTQDDPSEGLGKERDELLARRLEVEEQLAGARGKVAEAEQQLRDAERLRMETDKATQERRGGLEADRLKQNELEVRRQGQMEKLAELELHLEAILNDLAVDATESAWQRDLEILQQRIARLGPINLAAIDEYQSLEERKGYLDQQNDDLAEALETLESAIRKIDRETRQRFKETFDKVNEGVQRIFPRLFGGGQGYLEMTGEDLLETGVSVMARPPGKRITNIHLLSGGEKALTAVALVFAIFELNPAPFCMLDEVDAPLDEANVGRFCGMLQEMSKRVQFIFITHNKPTMEIAQHMIGVTMHEPGVSRLVAVDVEEAVQMATA